MPESQGMTIHNILKNDGIHYVAINRPTFTPTLVLEWESVGDVGKLDDVAERMRLTLGTLGVSRLRLSTDGLDEDLAVCCERIDDYVVVVAVSNGHPIVKSLRRMVRNLVKSERKHGPCTAPALEATPGFSSDPDIRSIQEAALMSAGGDIDGAIKATADAVTRALRRLS